MSDSKFLNKPSWRKLSDRLAELGVRDPDAAVEEIGRMGWSYSWMDEADRPVTS